MGGNEAETPGGRNQNQNLSPKKDFHTNKECSLNYIFTVHFGELERLVYGRSKINSLNLKQARIHSLGLLDNFVEKTEYLSRLPMPTSRPNVTLAYLKLDVNNFLSIVLSSKFENIKGVLFYYFLKKGLGLYLLTIIYHMPKKYMKNCICPNNNGCKEKIL